MFYGNRLKNVSNQSIMKRKTVKQLGFALKPDKRCAVQQGT